MGGLIKFVGGVIAVFWLAGAVVSTPHGSLQTVSDSPQSGTQYAKATKCYVTQAGYLSLRDGDNYSTVVSKLGCPGEELSRTEMMGTVTVMFQWWGDNWGANMNSMFQDGRLISKAQFGLK